MSTNNNIIPIMLCYDNNYVVPSAVAIYSLLKNSSEEYFYKIYVLHSDISKRNQQKLHKEVSKFKNASINFMNMEHKFDDVFSGTQAKAHYAKEMYYKLIAGSIFPNYDKIVITDVDVVFLGNIAPSYTEFKVSDDFYLAGIKMVNRMDCFLQNYEKNYNKEEQFLIKNGVGAGYLILNLKKIRRDGLEKKFLKFLESNLDRLIQPEQDTLNLCSNGKIKFLPLKYMTCSYMYDMYNLENIKNEKNFTKEELEEAYNNPIQLHYATHIKPWKQRNCTKAEIWFKYLKQTNFQIDYTVNKFKSTIFIGQKIKFLWSRCILKLKKNNA